MVDFRELIKNAKKIDNALPEFPPFFKFEEEGDWIEGVIQNPRVIEAEYGESQVVDIEVDSDDGKKVVYSLGLSRQLKPLWDMVGKRVIVKYDGKTKLSSGNRMKNFEIFEIQK